MGQIVDTARLRAELAHKKGKAYWRSLNELADTPAFREMLRDEFPRAGAIFDGFSRRNFLRVMAASLAFGGLTSCGRQPAEKIVPYQKPPEIAIPGRPLFFATAMTLGGYAVGLLAESHLGRPTKIEGNPGHPASLGGTGIYEQASILTMYDPDRSETVMRAGRISTWELFTAALTQLMAEQGASGGAGFRILTETVTSPALGHQIKEVLSLYPNAKWHQYEPLTRDAVREGARLAFGEYVETRYDFTKADVVVSLDADFLNEGPGHVRYARDFAQRRDVDDAPDRMNRLYAVESSPCATGAAADHRLPVRASQVQVFAQALAHAVGAPVAAADVSGLGGGAEAFLRAVAEDLKAHAGACVVVAGEHQPPAVHALAHAVNHALGNAGKTVIHTDPVEVAPVNQTESLADLVADLNAEKVELLLILGGNPVYDAPGDLKFAEALQKARQRMHFGLYYNETADLCHWHVPEAHFLESWGDARAFDGTVSIIQPLIAPLYQGKTAHDILAVCQNVTGQDAYTIVKNYWLTQDTTGNFELAWETALSEGIVEGTALPEKAVQFKGDLSALAAPPEPSGIEVIFRPDPTVADGRWANNGWLQELPKIMTKITWENAALVGIKTARRLGIAIESRDQSVIEVRVNGGSVQVPAWAVAGHPEDCVTLHVGYGRAKAGRVGDGIGVNVYPLRTSAAPYFATGGALRVTGAKANLARTEEHHLIEQNAVAHERHLIREGSLDEFKQHPEFAQHMGHHAPDDAMSMYPKWEHDGYAWGMTIDLNRCTGCSACMVACQSENNIPVVGKDQVERGREMHWIRVDRYYHGDESNPTTAHQPVPCMQCENAPCEVVCPVAATTHSAEGLNDMVYNRCVGTRYCSNNCPYKVRRFNFYKYYDDTPSKRLMYNPDVTVRSRGVMEKCTYCVQRINHARIEAKKEGRTIRDGEAVTACQQACPAGAITFGDIRDANSQVARSKQSPRNYGMLADLGTRPRTTYLAKIRNLNPALAGGDVKESHGGHA